MTRTHSIVAAAVAASLPVAALSSASQAQEGGAPLQIAAPPAPAPPPPPAPPKRPHPRFDTMHAAGGSGVRISRVMLDGSDNDRPGSGFGAQLAGESERYGVTGLYSAREAGFGFIGGGAVGFEGGIGGDMAWGVRAPFGRYHGPFFRAGVRGWLMGNDKLYSSFLELPQLQLGYQVLTTSSVLELGWRAGPVLAGRYNTGDDAARKLGKSFEVGSYTAVHLNPVHFELGLTRVLENDREGELDMLDGKLCGDAVVVRLCVDGRYYQGREMIAGRWAPLGNMTQAFYGGFTVGMSHGTMSAFEPHPERR